MPRRARSRPAWGFSRERTGRQAARATSAPTEEGDMATAELTLKDLDGPVDPDWCPGCGDFGVLKSIKEALLELHIPPHEVLLVAGLGRSPNLPGFICAYGLANPDGPAVPAAYGGGCGDHAL